MLFELTTNQLKAIFCRFFIVYLYLYMHFIDYFCHFIDVIANIVQDLKKTFLYN
jgi:hypothetical protein